MFAKRARARTVEMPNVIFGYTSKRRTDSDNARFCRVPLRIESNAGLALAYSVFRVHCAGYAWFRYCGVYRVAGNRCDAPQQMHSICWGFVVTVANQSNNIDLMKRARVDGNDTRRKSLKRLKIETCYLDDFKIIPWKSKNFTKLKILLYCSIDSCRFYEDTVHTKIPWSSIYLNIIHNYSKMTLKISKIM